MLASGVNQAKTMAEETKIKIDVSQVLSAFDEIDKQIASLEGNLSELKTTIKDTFDTKVLEKYGNEAGASTADVDALKKKLDEIDKTGTKISGKKFFDSSVIKNIQVGGKSLGEWSDSAQEVVGKLDKATGATTKLGVAQKVLNFIIKASPIAFLIGLVGSVITYFTKFQSGIDKVSQVMSGFNAVVDVVVQRFIKFGSAIATIVTGNFAAGFSEIQDSVTGLGAALVDAAINAANLEKEMQAIRDISLTSSVTTERQKNTLESLSEVYDNERKGFAERVRAAKEAGAIEKQIADDAFDLALRKRQAALADFQQNTEIQDKKETLAQAEIALIQAQTKVTATAFAAEKRVQGLRSQAADERKKQREKEAAELEKQLAELEKLKATIEKVKVAVTPEGLYSELAQVEKKYNDLAAETQAGINKLQEIEKKRGLSPEQKQALEDLADLQIKIEERRLSAIIDVLSDFNEKQDKLNDEQIKKREELADREQKSAQESLKSEKSIRDSQIALAEERGNQLVLIAQKSGAKQEEVEKLKKAFQLATQRARLESELKFQQDLLSITDAGDTKQIEGIRQKIALLQEQLKTINIDITTPDISNKKPKSLLELLGLDLKDIPIVEKAAQQIVDSLSKISAARVEEATAAVESADRKVEAATEALDREIELAQLGFASNVDRKREELETTKQAQKEAIAEQKKAAKTQLLIDSSIQASGIITSTVNLVKSWSTIPFGVGLLAAAAQIAGLFALITNIKSKARAISSTARYGKTGFITEKGIVDGRMHSQGGERLEVERGELVQVLDDGTTKRLHVVRRENTAKYSTLLSAANEGDDSKVVSAAFDLVAFKQMPVHIQNQIIERYIEKHEKGLPASEIPVHAQNRIIAQNNLSGSSLGMTIAIKESNMPELNQHKVAKRVAGNSKTTVTIDNNQTNEILQKMLAVMIKQTAKPPEQWTNNGNTRIRGGVKTNYSNGRN